MDRTCHQIWEVRQGVCIYVGLILCLERQWGEIHLEEGSLWTISPNILLWKNANQEIIWRLVELGNALELSDRRLSQLPGI